MSSSVGVMKFPILMDSHKIPWFQIAKPPTPDMGFTMVFTMIYLSINGYLPIGKHFHESSEMF